MLVKTLTKAVDFVSKPREAKLNSNSLSVDDQYRKSIAIVGCGYVADYYLKTLSLHPQLQIAGVMDHISERAYKLAAYYAIPRVYSYLAELLDDEEVDIVLNLTNPSSHYSVSQACLAAGKHVYSEKPLAMQMWQAEELVKLAQQQGLYLSSAPCSLLSETAQTIWKALRENQIGTVRLVYAEMDDGLVHLMPYKKWVSESPTFNPDKTGQPLSLVWCLRSCFMAGQTAAPGQIRTLNQ